MGKQQSGFTLIELLISMSIILVVSSVMLVVFFTTIRGTEKSQQLILVRQNGNFAMTQMTKTIRLTKTLDDSACTTEEGSSEITIEDNDEEKTYTCNEAEENISVSNADGSEHSTLIDQSSVRMTSCRFYCGYREGSNAPYVTIKFTLISKNRSAPGKPFGKPIVNEKMPLTTGRFPTLTDAISAPPVGASNRAIVMSKFPSAGAPLKFRLP